MSVTYFLPTLIGNMRYSTVGCGRQVRLMLRSAATVGVRRTTACGLRDGLQNLLT